MRGNRWSIQCRDSEELDKIIKSFIAYLFDVENEKGETVIDKDDAVVITDFKGRYEEQVARFAIPYWQPRKQPMQSEK